LRWSAIFTVFFRALILYFLIIITIRCMGKRQIGQLQPFELVVTILIAEIAATPMANTGIPLIYGAISIIVLFAVHNVIAFTTMKSQKMRGVVSGKPNIIISNGKIMEEELYKLNFNLDELVEQLRIQNAPNISQIQYAILETNGHLSVILQPQARPLTPLDMSISPQPAGLPVSLVLEGRLDRKNLSLSGRDEIWLRQALSSSGFYDERYVLIAALDDKGVLHIQGRLPDDRIARYPAQGG